MNVLRHFCLLASSILLCQAEESASYDRGSDPHDFTVFMQEGGWCWFQDPRVVTHDGKLWIGSVRGNDKGEALVGVYDLEAGKPLGTSVMHPSFDRDDHNSPVFHIREDGKVLALYARHNVDSFHHSRVADPKHPLKWSDEKRHERKHPSKQDRVTYMNFCNLSDEKKLYLFYRGISFNPTFVTSEDDGETWSEPVWFFKSEVKGRHRPYARYADNGKDTVHVSITDAHPRNFGNSIYYFQYRDGQFYKADGTRIQDLAEDGPIRPSKSEMIYKGSMIENQANKRSSVPGAAWTSSIALDSKGHPHIAYSLHLSNEDHRYRLASWNGKRWIDREVAHAGKCLYAKESSYTGLITLDPVDPTIAFISTDVDPRTGEDTGGKHEIYRASIGPEDDIKSIEWTAVTKNSPVRNIRPVIVRDDNRRIVLWSRGDFRTFINYQLDAVGFIEPAH